MNEFKLMPLRGINTVVEDAGTIHVDNAGRKVYMRDAVNGDFTAEGRWISRPGATQVSDTPLENLWYSPLFNELFATLAGGWVKVDPATWGTTVLAYVGKGRVFHLALNGRVLVAGSEGIFAYNGRTAEPLAIRNPSPPLARAAATGSMYPGGYAVAASFLRGSAESGLSEAISAEVPVDGSLEVTLPACFDPTVTAVRLYLSAHGGGTLYAMGDYPPSTTVSFSTPLQHGATERFRYLEAMPSGKYLSYWRGRILVARANTVYFSQALTYHLHDPRHDFVQMPQRVTFLAPVDGGIWVGQVDHVIFLAGEELNALNVDMKNARSPVPGSAILVESELVAASLSRSSATTAVWLAENGYVLGTSTGEMVEMSAAVLSGISGNDGCTAVVDRKLLTLTR